jgi:hypothetical protein
VPFALFSQFYNFCLLALDSSQAFELWFEGHVFIIFEEKMPQDKKTVAETKLTVEAKTLKIGPGGQVMQSLENQQSNRVILIT